MSLVGDEKIIIISFICPVITCLQRQLKNCLLRTPCSTANIWEKQLWPTPWNNTLHLTWKVMIYCFSPYLNSQLEL